MSGAGDSRAREAFERALAGGTRALADEADLSVRFTSDAPGNGPYEVRLTILPYKAESSDVAEIRGQADAYALRRRYHDTAMHVRLAPDGSLARAVFDELETARVETIGARALDGVKANLHSHLTERMKAAGLTGSAGELEEGSMTDIASIIGLMARERMGGCPVPEECAAQVAARSHWLEDIVGRHLDVMCDKLLDQKAAAVVARTLIADLIGDEQGEDLDPDKEDRDEEKDGESAGDQAPADDRGEGDDDGAGDEGGGDVEENSDDTGDDDQGTEAAIDSLADADANPGDSRLEGTVPWRPNRPLEEIPTADFYEVYTKAFDEVIKAEELCDQDELERLRKYLDQQMAHLQSAVSKLANRLQRRLLAQQQRHWQFDLEEGMLDAGRLSRVVTNPTHPLSYKMESETDFKDTVVTLLLDNSGSMRGRPISIAAISADILARTLERCGVSVEILGFTTKAWKGGQSREGWLEAGRPGNPGRLNDLRHIIYKTADSPWRRARRNLGLMMREGLLKENIDGEALLWAHNRLIARHEDRRILMVISDGAPVDDSTLSANSGTYLEKHLRQVINWIETRSPIELIAIGIGHDVTRYYKRAVTILDAEQLGGAMTEQLATLFEETLPTPAFARRR